MKTKSDYALLLFLLAENEEQTNFAKQEAQKILNDKKIVKQLDETTSTITQKTVEKLKKKFGISFKEK